MARLQGSYLVNEKDVDNLDDSDDAAADDVDMDKADFSNKPSQLTFKNNSKPNTNPPSNKKGSEIELQNLITQDKSKLHIIKEEDDSNNISAQVLTDSD